LVSRRSNDISNQDLIDALQGGRESFVVFYENFKGPIMSYLNAMLQDRGLAEELTQETFLKAYRTRDSFQPNAKVSTWLWTIAKNTAFDYFKKKKELSLTEFENDEGESFTLLDQLESPLPDSEAALIEASDQGLIEKCLSELTSVEKQILGLRIFSELSYNEIADQFAMPLGTIKIGIFRAKKKLTDCFKKREQCHE
jgi:RNA polymerase sigma-70 factor (ECF subfamily)